MTELKPESPQKLIRMLAGGIVSWLTFQQVAKRSKMYGERFVYPPIFELASARNWRVSPEFPVKLKGYKRKKKIDFLFYKNRKHVALEIKYISDKSELSVITQKILEDEKRLQCFEVKKSKKNVKTSLLYRYLMIIAKENNLASFCHRHNDPADLLVRARKILNPNDSEDEELKGFGRVYYSSIPFLRKSDQDDIPRRWCVMVLFVTPLENSQAGISQ